MKQVTGHQAKTHISRLIKDALEDEAIIIAKGNQPVVKLVVMPEMHKQCQISTYSGFRPLYG